jgi:Holliday junction resolvasome RuvABC endonuclease subunit
MTLDLSSCVGWAYGLTDSNAPRFGVWRLPHIGGEGAKYCAFENELAAAIGVLRPGSLVLEASLSLQALAGVSTIAVARQQLTLRGIAYSEAYRASIPISEVSSDIVRLAVLGTSRFAKNQVKYEVVRYCRSIGLMVPDHNAADAVLVWLWYKGQMNRTSPVAGPLFRSTRDAVN